ncbi:endolytic transglycosylase MltG [Patescibacteria group bacterium]|nr:endolytic transglycosylase MltG [Patescibacteria group bacterium]
MRAIIGTVVIGVVAFGYLFVVSAPLPYPVGEVLKVERGQTIASIERELMDLRAIRTPYVFSVCARFFGPSRAGWYALHAPEDACMLAYRLARGDTRLAALRITIPEGYTAREISELVGGPIDSNLEGYLFPDTYVIIPGTPVGEIVSHLRARYEEAVAPLRPEILASGRTEQEILTMASILEKEARLPETRRIVAGILWKRLDMGMPLQVDAVFGYIRGIDTYSPSFADLEIDSPYNTYKNAGLPPGPINNPGIDTIRAALEPEPSPYLYYLTGADGTMHYARTFTEHVANRKYLR